MEDPYTLLWSHHDAERKTEDKQKTKQTNKKPTKKKTNTPNTQGTTSGMMKVDPAGWEIMTCASSKELVWQEMKATEQETEQKSPYERQALWTSLFNSLAPAAIALAVTFLR